MLLRILLLSLAIASCQARTPARGPDRVVSLSPEITQTLFAIGAGDSVVGVTDYDDDPPEVKTRTRVGTMLQPNYEAIARTQPTLIVGESIRSAPTDRLAAIGPTHVLPWLSLPEVVSSVRELGRLTNHAQAADVLATKLSGIVPAVSPSSPRVLLVVADVPGQLSEVWYVKRSSLHGAVLEAAGGRNAVAEEVTGAPVLSLERLLAINPDIVFLLVGHDVTADVKRAYVDAWSKLPIKAVQDHAVRVLAGPDVQSTGPAILKLRDRLRAALQDVEAKR